jgi:hypothetical protein
MNVRIFLSVQRMYTEHAAKNLFFRQIRKTVELQILISISAKQNLVLSACQCLKNAEARGLRRSTLSKDSDNTILTLIIL